jgi:hypothetical protein
MQKQLESPIVQEHFQEGDGPEETKSEHREEAIRQFALH